MHGITEKGIVLQEGEKEKRSKEMPLKAQKNPTLH
jgi:hypothetical protein